LFYGYHENETYEWYFDPGITVTMPPQDIFLSDPVLFGKDGLVTGETINDTGAGEVIVKIGSYRFTCDITVDSTVTYKDFVPQVFTHMGIFTHILRVEWSMSGEFKPPYIPSTIPLPDLIGNTFQLKEKKGMVIQNQKPDANDPAKHAVDAGAVAGVPLQADFTPTPTPKPTL
jgi:hypothetical protein